MPQPMTPLSVSSTSSTSPSEKSPPTERPSLPSRIIKSASNLFGCFREYTTYPSHDPDKTTSLEDLSNIPLNPSLNPPISSPLSPPISVIPSLSKRTPSDSDSESFSPFANWSIFALMNWMWTGSRQKSHTELDRLVNDVLSHPRFQPSDLASFSSVRETERLDASLAFEGDGWIESEVTIEVPDGKKHGGVPSDTPIPTFSVPGFQRRSIVQIIRTVWADTSSRYFHFTSFKLFWSRIGGPVERVHGELYTSDSFLKAHQELQNSAREPGCTLERVICGLMFWSDSTHLATFGNASLWPIYLFFGNQSKYTRCRPSSGACHHLAYIPKVCTFDCMRCYFH